MKRMKKRLAFLMACGILAAGLASCSSGGGGAATEGDENDTNDKETEETTKAESSGNAISVDVWHYFENEADALEKIAEQYNDMQDEINIVCTYVSREELMKQYTIGAVSGELPDIGMVDSPDMASYIELGVFEDITDYLENWDDLEQFYPGPLSSVMDSDGRYYGLPNNSNCLALLCNMDMLREAGFDSPPATWDEFKEIAEATTNAADSVYGFAMSAISNEEGTFQFIPWLYSSGASVSSLDSPEAVKSLSFLTDLCNDGYMSKEVVNWSQGDAYNAFTAGKAAMLESGTWHISTLDEDVDGKFEYEYALLPKDEKFSSVIGGENFGVCVGSEATEACVEFIKYMQTAENNADWCEISGKIPVREDASKLKIVWTDDARYSVFVDGMNYAVARGPHSEWPVISEAVYTAVQASIIGEKTPEDALKDAAAVVSPILEANPIAG